LAAFWTSIELFVQYSYSKVCPKTAASSPSCQVTGGKALTLTTIIMPTTRLTSTVSIPFMMNHTAPAIRGIPSL